MKKLMKLSLLLISTMFCTSCATTVGMTAAAITSATIAVGAAIITAPFKLIGAMDGDEEDDNDTEEN